MKKLKRILAILMVILLAGLFIAAIVLAITGAPANQLMAVIFSIVFISVLFYAMGLMTRVLKRDESKSEEKNNKVYDKNSCLQSQAAVSFYLSLRAVSRKHIHF